MPQPNIMRPFYIFTASTCIFLSWAFFAAWGYSLGRINTLSSLLTFGPGRIEKMCLEAGVKFRSSKINSSTSTDARDREVDSGLVSEMRRILERQVKDEMRGDVVREVRGELKREVRSQLTRNGGVDLGVVMEAVGDVRREMREDVRRELRAEMRETVRSVREEVRREQELAGWERARREGIRRQDRPPPYEL